MAHHSRSYQATQPRRPTRASTLVNGRVHVVGPVCLDLVFSGLTAAPRPGTEVRAHHLGISPGGMANVAVALSRLGADVALSAVLADDAFGRYLWSSLADEGVDLAFSARLGGWNTPVTSSVAIAPERAMVTYQEEPPVAATSLLPEGYGAAAVVVSLADADAGWLGGLHNFAPLVFADVGWDDQAASPRDLGARLGGVDVFLPNAAEALALSGAGTVTEAARRLATHGPLVVVKDGGAGSVAFATGMDAPVTAPAVRVEALDTTGAGDVFDAGFVYATLAGWPLSRRLRFANLCAAESVKLVGGSLAAPCWRDLAAFWQGLEDTDARQEYRFLDEVMVEARLGRDCRRSFPTLGAMWAMGVAATNEAGGRRAPR